MFARPPKETELKALGLTVEDYPVEVHEVWPENWPSVLLFRACRTQWRAGPGGVIGLDMAIVYRELDRQNLSREAYEQLLSDIRVMEDAALSEIYKAE